MEVEFPEKSIRPYLTLEWPLTHGGGGVKFSGKNVTKV